MVEVALGVGEPGAEPEELLCRLRDGVEEEPDCCWATGSITRSCTIGGGSIGLRSANRIRKIE